MEQVLNTHSRVSTSIWTVVGTEVAAALTAGRLARMALLCLHALLALWAVLSAVNAAASELGAEAAASIASTVPNAISVAAATSATSTAGAGELSYAALMKLSPDARKERVQGLSSDDRFTFLSAISGMQRAVLLVDPADCNGWAQIQRRSIATSEVGRDGFGATLKQEGQGWLKSTLLSFVPGGRLIEQADTLNELRKYGNKHSEYEDVCEMPLESRVALLIPEEGANPVAQAQNKRETDDRSATAAK